MADEGLSPDEERVIDSLLDVIVPPSSDGRLPGAGTLGLTAHIARVVARTPVLRPVIEYGVSALTDLARGRHAREFTELSETDRAAVFREFAATDQFFLPAFLYLVYSGYYEHPRVVEALGLEARPPHPQGHAMEESDLALLDPVRRRGPMYRE